MTFATGDAVLWIAIAVVCVVFAGLAIAAFRRPRASRAVHDASFVMADAVPAPPAVPANETDIAVRIATARTLAANGDLTAAASLLRECLWQAGERCQKDAQAEARLELGDVCFAAGDRITACEHWQIARDYFHAAGQAEAADGAEKRMRTNGCPTDWVLNDF